MRKKSNTPADVTSNPTLLPSVKAALSEIAASGPIAAVSPTNGAGNGAAHTDGAAPHDTPKAPASAGGSTPIPKPDTQFSLEKFRSKRDDHLGHVDPYQDGLPHHKIADAKDYVRLHDEARYWSPELTFVHVPNKGQKDKLLHLISQELAEEYLPPGIIIRHSLVLASKPNDVFFLAEVPTQNLDNDWNATSLHGAEMCKTGWYMLISQKAEGKESYKIVPAKHQDAFDKPKWPKASLTLLIERTFVGRLIEREDHPALLRLIGARQNLK